MVHAPPTAAYWLERIRALALPGPVKILNVCGGHERSISAAGLRADPWWLVINRPPAGEEEAP